jgi:hypothetical protein
MGVQITCYKCRCEYVLPDELYTAAKRSADIYFWCPYGHQAHYPEGETEADKLRRERDRLTQRLAQKDDAIKYWRENGERVERRLSATRGVVTRMRNRVGAGVCPCCTRSFGNLARHMKSKHPSFRTEAAE